MQKNKRDVYEEVEKRFGIPLPLVQSVGDFVMKEWVAWQKYPDNLNLKVRNLGTQVLRSKRNLKEIERIKKQIALAEEGTRYVEQERALELKAFAENLEYLLGPVYDEYREARKKVRNQNVKEDNVE